MRSLNEQLNLRKSFKNALIACPQKECTMQAFVFLLKIPTVLVNETLVKEKVNAQLTLLCK